jgi:hypothetical protein
LKQAVAFTGGHRYPAGGQKFFAARIFQQKFAATKNFNILKMKSVSICLIAAGILFCMEGNAQISFKTEYIGNSAYMYAPSGDESSVKVGHSEGSAIVCQGMANIPVYMKKNENGRPVAWGVGLGGAYASLNNKNFTDDMVAEIMNLKTPR